MSIRGYVKCKCCRDKLYEGEKAYYHDGEIYCCPDCLAKDCEITIEYDDCNRDEEVDDFDWDAYNDDKKLGLI